LFVFAFVNQISKVITLLGMKPAVAPATQRHKIFPIIVSAVCQPFDMVNGISGSQLSFSLAHDTQRISGKVRCTNFTPPSAVPLIAFGVTLVLVVLLHRIFGVSVAEAV